mgnify:CR=1 FL=1
MKMDAKLSDCNTYRYYLTRQWDETLPYVNFIGLNPSTADATIDDPTIRKCMKYARNWGYGGIIMTNLFAFRSPYPEELFKYQGDKIGSKNNDYLKKGSMEAKISIAAWGDNGTHDERGAAVMRLIDNLYCLKKSKVGQPRHPLYLKGDLMPIEL